ncbi:MAG: hypothetical protein JW971_04200 [Synergistales bacterium]|nr:hypothetical protein [Synergistales bacterium]
MKKREIIELRGIKREEFMDYFVALGGENMGNGKIRGVFWEVEIGPQEHLCLGPLELPTVKIIFQVEEGSFKAFLSDFRMKFIRGGG